MTFQFRGTISENADSLAILSGSCVSIKRNVGPNAALLGPVGCPVDLRIENLCTAVRVPLQAGVRSAARSSSLSDDEANVFRAMRMHHVVKRDRFSFAISGGIKFNFSGRLALSGRSATASSIADFIFSRVRMSPNTTAFMSARNLRARYLTCLGKFNGG